MEKKTGFVDIEKLENEADVMSNAGGKPTTWYCSKTCRTSDFVYSKPFTYVCGECVPIPGEEPIKGPNAR